MEDESTLRDVFKVLVRRRKLIVAYQKLARDPAPSQEVIDKACLAGELGTRRLQES